MGKQWKQWLTLFFWVGSKITADSDCSHEIKRRLLLGRKVLTNLDSILKSRDITLSIKVHLVKAIVFPVVMYGYESWTKKKAECQRNDAFELWCWRRLMRVPLDCKEIQPVHPKGNQSWIFTGRTDIEAETPILWLPDAKSWLIWKDLMLGKIEGRRRRGWQKIRWLNGITNSMDMGLGGLQELVIRQGGLACCSSWGFKESDTTERQNWTEPSGKSKNLVYTFLSKITRVLGEVVFKLTNNALTYEKMGKKCTPWLIS